MKKGLVLFLSAVLLLINLQVMAAEKFEAFEMKYSIAGMEGTTFRFVVPLSSLPSEKADIYINCRVDGLLHVSGLETTFHSYISAVEEREGALVLVVPETLDIKAVDLKGYLNEGGKFNLNIDPEKVNPETFTKTAGETSGTRTDDNEQEELLSDFKLKYTGVGMEGKNFRFVAPLSGLPVKTPASYKNCKISGYLTVNGKDHTFESYLSDVESREGELVFVVPETADVKAADLKKYLDAGGKFDLTIKKEKTEPSVNNPRPNFEDLPDFGDIFEPYLTKQAPQIIKTLSEATVDGVKQTEIQFASYNGKNKIYAKIYQPEKEGNYPGIVLYHGGGGNASANSEFAQLAAQNGYIAITPDLPGIGDPAKMPNTEGAFKAKGYSQEAQIGMDTDPRNSTVFEGQIAAIDAFYLLASFDEVEKEHIGITGGSWGGYTTTKIAGLLGDDVACAYSTYGCAYYDEGTHWSKNVFPKFGETNKLLWMKYLDASATIKGISCPYFIEAPTNDEYFFPNAVQKTLDHISSYTNKAFTANMNHTPYSSSNEQRLAYFNYYLKGIGNPILEIKDLSAGAQTQEGLPVSFTLSDDRELKMCSVYFANADLDWSEKKWQKINVSVENGAGTVCLPSYSLYENTILYAFAVDEEKCYSSSEMITVNNLTVKELTEEEKMEMAQANIIVSTADESFTSTGVWAESGIMGYEYKSKYSFSSEATAVFRPVLKNGAYEVSVYVVKYTTNQPYLHVTIHTAKGDVEKDISTDIVESDWVSLGTFDFAGGSSGGVTLSVYDKTLTEAKDQLVNPIRVDSVRFVKKEDINENEITVLLRGEKLLFPADQRPVIINDRTLVPFRAIFEALGLTVGWDQDTNTAFGEKEGLSLSLTIDSLKSTVNGEEKYTDVPPQLIADRTYVPLRFLSENVGFEVQWNEETQTVSITDR